MRDEIRPLHHGGNLARFIGKQRRLFNGLLVNIGQLLDERRDRLFRVEKAGKPLHDRAAFHHRHAELDDPVALFRPVSGCLQINNDKAHCHKRSPQNEKGRKAPF